MNGNFSGQLHFNHTDDNLQPTVTTIAEFLAFVAPNSRVLLCAIDADGKVMGESFDDYEKAERWAIEKNDAGCNLYWTVNLVRKGVTGKPDKTEIQAARGFWADADPNVKCFGSYEAARTGSGALTFSYTMDGSHNLKLFTRYCSFLS